MERSLNYFHEPVDTLGVVTGTDLVTGTNAHELLAYRAVGSLTHHALVLIAPDLNISWASPNFSRILGYDAAEIPRLNVIELVHPDDMDLVLPLAMAVVDDAGGHVERPARAAGVELPVRVRTREGRWLPVGITGRVADEEGRLICVLRADPERHALDLVLTQLGTGAVLDDVLTAVVELVRAQFGFDGVLIVHDADGNATSVGEPAMCFDSAGLLTQLRAEPVFSDELRAEAGRWIVPITSPGRDHLWGAFVLAASEGLEPKPFDHFVIDRSRQLAALAFSNAQDHRELRRAATHDHLTGVLSRGEFESQVERLVERRELPVVVLFVDLDGFKAVNDNWGHHDGDEVLVAVAKRLQDAVRPTDSVARLGGDEFAILCRGLQPHQARPTVERISRSLMTPVRTSKATVQIGASIGIATAQHPNQIDGLLQRADAEMYRLKRLRRAC